MSVHFNPVANSAVDNSGADAALLPLNLGQVSQVNGTNLDALDNLPQLDLGQVGSINITGLAALANLSNPNSPELDQVGMIEYDDWAVLAKCE